MNTALVVLRRVQDRLQERHSAVMEKPDAAEFAALGSRTRIGASEPAGAVRGRSLQRKQTRLQQQHHQGEIAGQFTGGNE
jgi:hypothetical protein